MTEQGVFRPEEILQRLVAAGVRFIMIGGLAAQAYGSTSGTFDLDVCFARDRSNLEKLALVLTDVSAVRRGLPPDAPAMPPLDVRTLLAGNSFTLDTRFGRFDLVAVPDPGLDYGTLASGSVTMALGGLEMRVASLDDLIAMKRAAGRPKDLVELEILGALREEIDRRA